METKGLFLPLKADEKEVQNLKNSFDKGITSDLKKLKREVMTS
jgi:hypothetical protein